MAMANDRNIHCSSLIFHASFVFASLLWLLNKHIYFLRINVAKSRGQLMNRHRLPGCDGKKGAEKQKKAGKTVLRGKAGGKERKPNLSCIIIGASTPDAADITHKGSPSKYTSGRKYSNDI